MGIWHRIVGGGDETIERARRPQAAAGALAAPPKQGLDWLGREPTADAPNIPESLAGSQVPSLESLARGYIAAAEGAGFSLEDAIQALYEIAAKDTVQHAVQALQGLDSAPEANAA